MKKTIVLVTDQFACERIIQAGSTVAKLSNTTLNIFSVLSPSIPVNPIALEYLFKVSKEHGATMTVTYSDEPIKTIIKFIKNQKTINVITGLPENKQSVLYKIWQKFTHIRFFTVDKEGEFREVADKFDDQTA